MKITVHEHFLPVFDVKKRYLLLYGGGGSGKSELAGRKLFKRSMEEGGHRFLIMRKVRARCRESVIGLCLSILNQNEIKYRYNKSDRIIFFYGANGYPNEWLFDGLDDPEKIKSIKGITGVWLEEATEFSRDDFLQIDLRLREPTPFYKQIMMTFNPDEAKGPWIKERFFDAKDKDAFLHHSTIEHNPIPAVRAEYAEVLAKLAGDPVYWKIYRLGEWAMAKGIIFNWDVVPLPAIRFDSIFFGGDFGYSINPSAIVKIYRKADEFWIQELIYETRLTNPALCEAMRREGIGEYDPIYFDSAEPKSIDEIAAEGFNAKPAEKGPDSVRAGIQFMKGKTIHIVEGSENLKDEVRSYKWREDRSGKTLPIPVDFKNHAISAARYAISTHCRPADSRVFLEYPKADFFEGLAR